MVRIAVGTLLASLVIALAVGPVVAVAGADAKPSCRSGYLPRRKRGVWRCVLQPRKPKPPRDAVYPSEIELIVGKIEKKKFNATGYMRFSKRVTGTAYGEWILSNGVARERLPFSLRNLKDLDYIPFTIGYPIPVHISGKSVTARLVIGRTSSNSIVLIQR